MNKLLTIIALIGLASVAYAQTDKTYCNPDFFWDGQKCEQCMPGCVCSSFWGCNSCLAGYFFNSSTKTCKKCTDGGVNSIGECCYEMTTASATTNGGRLWAIRAESCISSHKLFSSSLGNSGVCTPILNCAQFSDEGICTSCNAGFWLNENNMCRDCSSVDGCAVCSTTGQCQTCREGYYMAVTTKDTENPASKCVPCDAGCICDNVDNTCKACINNTYYLKDDTNPKKVCEACSVKYANSVTCNAKNLLTCQDFYKPAADNMSCKVCPTNCLFESCSFDTTQGDTKCSKCVPHFYIDATDGTCKECDTGSFDYCNGADGKTLVQCGGAISTGMASFSTTYPHSNQRYLVNVKNADKTAKECVSNVNNCMKIKENNDKGKDLCDSCYTSQGWYLTTDAKCLSCPKEITNCVECTVKETALNCKTCQMGYYKAGDTTCTKCQDGCSSCDASDNCLINCDIGYRTVTAGGKKTCEVCSSSAGDGRCAVCQAAADKCEGCKPGFRLWKKTDAGTDTIRCEACETNCLKCDGARKTCTECQSGYFVSSNGVCKLALANCASWTRNGGVCDLCDYGYRLIDANGQQVCVACGGASMGYWNCQNKCSTKGTWPYRRDGVLYTSQTEEDRNKSNSDPNAPTTSGSNSTIMAINAIFFIALALFF